LESRHFIFSLAIAAFLALKMLFREIKGNWEGNSGSGSPGSTNKFQIVSKSDWGILSTTRSKKEGRP